MAEMLCLCWRLQDNVKRFQTERSINYENGHLERLVVCVSRKSE